MMKFLLNACEVKAVQFKYLVKAVTRAVALITICAAAVASPITYSFQISDATETITGSISTDGFVGPLNASHITAWNFESSGNMPSLQIDSTMPGALVMCIAGGPLCGLSASQTELTYQFDVSGGPGSEGIFFAADYWNQFLFFTSGNASAWGYFGNLGSHIANFCNAPDPQCVGSPGLLTVGVAVAPAAVPEPESLALVATGLFVLVATRRRKQT